MNTMSKLTFAVARRLWFRGASEIRMLSEGLSPWIHTVHWCEMRSGKSCEVFSVFSPRCCIVPPEVSEASRSAKEVLVQGSVTYTCDPEYIIGAFATLTGEFTRTCLFHTITSSDGGPITSVSTCSEFVRWWNMLPLPPVLRELSSLGIEKQVGRRG